MCESACPNGLPVSTLFTMVGGKIQDMFEYVPGRSVEEEPPVSVFKEDELQTESGSGERH
jgi:formate dehydrogenase subunit beta